MCFRVGMGINRFGIRPHEDLDKRLPNHNGFWDPPQVRLWTHLSQIYRSPMDLTDLRVQDPLLRDIRTPSPRKV